MAKMAAKTGDKRAALDELDACLGIPPADSNDWITIKDGKKLREELAEELGRRERRGKGRRGRPD